jgi:ABC-type dipeptide/oligopeptide/nickel transport system permease subunit
MSEPLPSWGNLLAVFQQFDVMSSYWWMAAPLGALVLLSLAYFTLADSLYFREGMVASR